MSLSKIRTARAGTSRWHEGVKLNAQVMIAGNFRSETSESNQELCTEPQVPSAGPRDSEPESEREEDPWPAGGCYTVAMPVELDYYSIRTGPALPCKAARRQGATCRRVQRPPSGVADAVTVQSPGGPCHGDGV